ncbi:helix-turn-helix transcriptional regulator [Novosphingobium sediminicola]|uniref:Transcriptional regulator with XRE-family HTH domain n=1 Tax=Novosphingobium sediminicola TaxID=563162 RepID=A0A7W6G570_9SPHN|nr:helix-turn-helix transcriptional regulator [Novosphingobium sediminicola]MBB3954384.1 transcriptional regulator with XRE-family HTH domain [Novosphingobium sediminicola]
MLDEEHRNLLGAFVRARRESIAPDTPAMPERRRRRTPGLRREELAERAGISVTWVTWIEQGRSVRASAPTLARLAEGLSLTGAERAYLFTLAGREDPRDPFLPATQAPAAIAAMVEALPWPAYGLDPAWSVCCANAGARDLFVGLFETEPANLLRYIFTHPQARALLPDWDERCHRVLAEFRRDYGRVLGDPRVAAMVETLMAQSADFREAWAQQKVLAREGGTRRFQHPTRGPLCFTQHTLAEVERGDFRLVVLQPLD